MNSKIHSFVSLALGLATAVGVQAAPGDAVPLSAPADKLTSADREALRQDDAGLQVVTLPDGTQMVDLQGRYQMAATAAVDADGHVHQGCHSGHEIESSGIQAPVVSKPEER